MATTSAKSKAITSAKTRQRTTAFSKSKANKKCKYTNKVQNPSSVQKLQDTPAL